MPPSILGQNGLQMGAVPQPLPAPKLRSFDDAPATRGLIYQNVLHAAKNIEPLTNQRHTLALTDVDFNDPEEYSIADQKHAILSGKTLTRRLKGTWTLSDNVTGKVLDQKAQTIARVPFLTNRGTFVHRGNEYVLINQMRLKPGIFTRQKDNGEIEAHVNVMPGKGVGHRQYLDPAKGVFYMKMGQARLPLLPLLRAMGATDARLKEAWGDQLLAANYKHDDPSVVKKLIAKLVDKAGQALDEGGQQQALIKAIESMELDPEVTRRTLGQPISHLNLDAILATSKKLLGVSRGEQTVDDRDAMAYQKVYGPEDIIAERLSKDAGGLRRQLLWKSSFRGNLSGVLPGALDKQLESALLTSGLGQSAEEINPAEILDKVTRITRLGEGGIPSLDSIPDEARSVQPSHLNFLDPLRTPESFRAGVDVFIASSARKGDDGRMYAPFRDTRTDKIVYKSPEDVDEMTVTFPQEMKRTTKRVWALQNGDIKTVLKKDVNLVVPHFEQAFSPLGNLVPLKSAVKGQRAVMAARMMTQALPLVNPEAPLVQSGVPDEDGMSYEEKLAHNMGAMRAVKGGRVMDLGPGFIKVKYDDGTSANLDVYEHFPYNRKTFLHQTPVVRVGDTFKPQQLLARSNYTDANGVTALGKNMRTLYIPFRGLNFEDAVVISQSAADRLASEHMYQHSVDWGDRHRKGKRNYVSLFPSKFDRKTLEMLDDNGVVRPGTVVEYGQPLVLGAKQKEVAHNKLHRKNDPGWGDETLTWEHHAPGIVTDVLDTDKGTQVLVKSTNPMQIGDKLSGRYGDKGVVADIIPDAQMPHGPDNQPYELLLNPLGITTRTNPAQKIETALGRIAMLTGRPYRVPDFESFDDLEKYAEDELKKYGLDDITEDVTDPETGRKIKAVAAGSRFFMKLHHTAESKGQGRGTGGYTTAGEPAKGGETGSKRLSIMDQNALLSHGALEVMRDAGAIRGQRNEDYWLAFLQGHTPPQPKVPMIYNKFVNELKASGINVLQDGPRMQLMALTDKDVTRLAGDREIKTGDTVDWGRALAPIAGGLFDPAATGGHNGNRWSYIRLTEPMPNPVFEEPIRRVLGLTQKEFDEVIAGKKSIGSGTGPKAIQQALSKINVAAELEKCRAAIHGGRKTARDIAVRRMGYLKSAERLGIHPRDWVLARVPVLPPMFRPVSVMSGSKQPLVADSNYLYKELLEANDNLRNMSSQVEDLSDERSALYSSFKAVTGLADPVHPKLIEKNVKGILKAVFGSSPKFGTVQRRLMSSTTDLVGRAVVRPNPDLDMDHVGLPENKAWDVYQNFVVRRLKRRGMPVTEAMRHVKDRSELARKELIGEMEERPVIVNRAPVLHRWGIMAFYPKLVKEDTLQVSPLIVKGFGMDFDGDAVQYHVPVDDAAKKEAIERMLPSRNLLSAADFKSPWHLPQNEYQAGLYAATSPQSKRKPKVFRSLKDAYAAFKRGDMDINDPVEIYE